jgi:protein-S-isoprenylcysteine O-methyltransferase Ste14
MIWRMSRTVIILPGTVLLFVPGAILWATATTTWAENPASAGDWPFWLAVVLFVPGMILAGWTSRLFLRVGEGTPVPWEPPKNLVVRGPYCYVRNPMISGVMILLVAEALVLRSWPIFLWAALFCVVNTIYFMWSEEPGLERRFGEDYRRYKASVPRWIPRVRPWEPS